MRKLATARPLELGKTIFELGWCQTTEIKMQWSIQRSSSTKVAHPGNTSELFLQQTGVRNCTNNRAYTAPPTHNLRVFPPHKMNRHANVVVKKTGAVFLNLN